MELEGTRCARLGVVRDTPKVLTLPEAAAILGLHANTVHRAARSGRLPGRRVGKEWRFLRTVVEEVAATGTRLRQPPSVAPPATPEAPVELTAHQAAEFLRVDPQTVWTEANASRLPAWKEGGEWRTTLRALTDYLSGDPQASERYGRPRRRSKDSSTE